MLFLLERYYTMYVRGDQLKHKMTPRLYKAISIVYPFLY